MHDSNRAPLDGARRFRIGVSQSPRVILWPCECSGRRLGEDDAPRQADKRRNEAEAKEPQHLSAFRTLRRIEQRRKRRDQSRERVDETQIIEGLPIGFGGVRRPRPDPQEDSVDDHQPHDEARHRPVP